MSSTKFSGNECTATYNGLTNRPLIKRIKEHEAHSRLDLDNPTDFSHICNLLLPTTHRPLDTSHKIVIGWDRTTILTTTIYKRQLDLTEHTAIKMSDTSLSRTDSAVNFMQLTLGSHNTKNCLHHKTYKVVESKDLIDTK